METGVAQVSLDIEKYKQELDERLSRAKEKMEAGLAVKVRRRIRSNVLPFHSRRDEINPRLSVPGQSVVAPLFTKLGGRCYTRCDQTHLKRESVHLRMIQEGRWDWV